MCNSLSKTEFSFFGHYLRKHNSLEVNIHICTGWPIFSGIVGARFSKTTCFVAILFHYSDIDIKKVKNVLF